MEGLTAAMDRVRAIERTLQGLQPARPGALVFSQALASATAPAAEQPVSGSVPSPMGSAAWTSAVQRPAFLTGAAAPLGTAPVAPTGAAALAAYGNGQIPEATLVAIGNGERLQAGAAENFLAMRDAAARAGVELTVNDSYRSLDEQRDMAARKGLYSQGGLAARPGTSKHGVGRSVDLHLDQAAQQWMGENAARFGYANDVAREPWHWTFTASDSVV